MSVFVFIWGYRVGVKGKEVRNYPSESTGEEEKIKNKKTKENKTKKEKKMEKIKEKRKRKEEKRKAPVENKYIKILTVKCANQ